MATSIEKPQSLTSIVLAYISWTFKTTPIAWYGVDQKWGEPLPWRFRSQVLTQNLCVDIPISKIIKGLVVGIANKIAH